MTSLEPCGASPGGPASAGRRWGALWVLAPLALGLAYAAASTLFERSPSLTDMVPKDAISVQRYRDLAAYDAMHPAPDQPGKVAPKASAILGADLNLPGLPGIDPKRPLLVVTLAPEGRGNPDVHILPVSDRGAVREVFLRPDLAERHAKHLAIHGKWAALGWDKDAVDQAGGGGGLSAEDRGEDWCRIADWPRLVDFALLHADEPPFTGILAALGFDASKSVVDEHGNRSVPAGRVARVRDAWKTVTLYGWADRIRAELVPAPGGDLAKALAASMRDLIASVGPRAAARLPFDTEAILSCFGADGRRVVALALRGAGVSFPDAVKIESFRLDAPGSLLLWAELAPGAMPSWTLGMAAPPAALPDLAAFLFPLDLLRLDGRFSTTSYPAGALSLAAPYGGESPAGTLEQVVAPSSIAVDVVALGVDGKTAAARMAALLEPAEAEAPLKEKGTVLLARFRLAQVPAQRILGRALAPGSILSPLAGGAIEGTLSTDGVRLIVEASREK